MLLFFVGNLFSVPSWRRSVTPRRFTTITRVASANSSSYSSATRAAFKEEKYKTVSLCFFFSLKGRFIFDNLPDSQINGLSSKS